MTREEAIALAAKHGPTTWLTQPAFWVIDAILEAANSSKTPNSSQGEVQRLTDAEIAAEDERIWQANGRLDFYSGARWAERTLCAKNSLTLKEQDHG